MTSFDGLIAGRLWALDRTSLPSLASRAASHAELQGGPLDVGRSTPKTQRAGATAIVPLVGVISSDPLINWLLGGVSPDAFASALREAVADASVSDVVLLVDSPGGEIGLIQETAAEIRRLRALKPITAIARTQMASAAFWLGAQASRVVATPSASVGSVGVFFAHAEQSRLNERVGITVTYISSDPKKVEGNPHQPLADDARAFLQSRVDAVYAQFLADLAAGRGLRLSQVAADFGGGRSFSADEALRRGMVNRVETFETLLSSSASGRRGMAASAPAGSDEEQRISDEHALLIMASQDYYDTLVRFRK